MLDSRYKLAYYSSIPCAPTFGGPLQIYRHFRERNDFEFIDLNTEKETQWDGWIPGWLAKSRLFKRLCRTRLYPWIIYASNHTLLRRQARDVAKQSKESRADALVTVAYGRRCHVCRLAAKMAGVPLITFYHDWWPDLMFGKTPRTLAWMDREFRHLAGDSDLILPVSKALLDELGKHPNAVVLPPIPVSAAAVHAGSMKPPIPALLDSQHPNCLVYAGTLQGAYGDMVRALAHEMLEHPDCGWILRCYGLASEWTEEERNILSACGVYGGMLAQGPELDHALSSADALLVVMDFLPENRRRVRTSFPSKILDYLVYRKPIIAWGPEDCAAVVWASQNTLGHSVTTADPGELIKHLPKLGKSGHIVDDSKNVNVPSPADYSAESIHSSLVAAIELTLTPA